MTEIHKDIINTDVTVKSFSYEGLAKRAFDSESGEIWCYECEKSRDLKRTGYFTKGNMPSSYCSIHGKTEEYVPACEKEKG